MLFHIALPIKTEFNIVLSRTETGIGWGIVLMESRTVLIDPTDELREYCQNDEIIEFDSNICIKNPRIFKFGPTKIYHGCYRQHPYIYISTTEDGGLLFTMGSEDYAKIVAKLKPSLVLTREGQIMRQGEAYLTSLLK